MLLICLYIHGYILYTHMYVEYKYVYIFTLAHPFKMSLSYLMLLMELKKLKRESSFCESTCGIVDIVSDTGSFSCY